MVDNGLKEELKALTWKFQLWFHAITGAVSSLNQTLGVHAYQPPPPLSAKQALSQEEARIKRSARLAPLESQTAKALVLRRRCDPPGCEEIVGGAAQGQDDITALGGVLEL